MTTTLDLATGTDAFTPTSSRTGHSVECLCPFCGAFNIGVGQACRHCHTEDTTAARAAARKRVGPWFLLQSRNPAAPGMSLQALLALIRQGVVTDRSVIRGPATGQLWRLAGKVRGISRVFGHCYGCAGDLYAADPLCPHCQRPQSLPPDIDAPAAPAPASYNPGRSDRPLPRHDLLTPRDLAKAFSLGFTATATNGTTTPVTPAAAPPSRASVTLDDLLPHARPAFARPRPATLAAAAAVVSILCVGWVLTHVLSRPAAPPATVAIVPAAAPIQAAPAVAAVPPAADELTFRPAMLVQSMPAPAPTPVEDNAATAGLNEPSDSPSDDPKRLMAAGLSAEANGDYATAVQQYERIESLSSDEWPAGLKDRLALARQAVRSGDKD